MAFQIVKLLDAIQLINVLGGLTPRGEYSELTDYQVGDAVSYEGSSYIMYVDAGAGTIPTDVDYWMVHAEKGDSTSLEEVGVEPPADSSSGIFYMLNDGNIKSLRFKYPNDEDPVVIDERLI